MRYDGGDSDVTGVLLVGGRSQRMGGKEKALLEIADEPMLAHVIAHMRPQVGAPLSMPTATLSASHPLACPSFPTQ